jgi:hypothetical protein
MVTERHHELSYFDPGASSTVLAAFIHKLPRAAVDLQGAAEDRAKGLGASHSAEFAQKGCRRGP